MPAKKGTKFNQYTFETKVEAIRLHIEEGWTYRRLMDQRGRRKEYVDQDRYVQKLKRENDMLKKCLEIRLQEMKHTNT
ncbi:hypothetical protein L8C07_07355 [Paenibacillus sp. CMAA1739]|uniref:hypothetical protein n=1 Tax=Paenibacillus ottowii TaxID=2315729 RepID=UPI00273049BA|nr:MULTISPECIES: hypothetical protein [Paenibacillus]MDP1510342.1 hypothetical protein [Paenibacillus ottowii]MEC4565758.1 hypothetical protein [Paenibacillus sp. CMAA1739]